MHIEEKYKVSEDIAKEIIRISKLENINYFPSVSSVEICIKDIVEHDYTNFFTDKVLNLIFEELKNVQTTEDLNTKKYGIDFYKNIQHIYIPKEPRAKGKIKCKIK